MFKIVRRIENSNRTVDVSRVTKVVSGRLWYFWNNVCTWTVMIVVAPNNSIVQNTVRVQFVAAIILPRPWAEV